MGSTDGPRAEAPVREHTGAEASVTAPRRRFGRRRKREEHTIASLDSLLRRVEESSHATGRSPDEAAAAVVQDLESSAAALNARTAPMVPGCGVLVALTGVLLKSEPSSDGLSEFFIGLAILFAVGGLAFLARGLFMYAGRRVIGLAPTVADIAFAHERLVVKQSASHRGGVLAGIGLGCLIVGILLGVHIQIGTN